MPINETLTGNATSAIANPANLTSDVAVSGTFGASGHVVLKCGVGGQEHVIADFFNDKAVVVATPDSSAEYWFESTNVTSVNVYFGP